MLHASYSMRFNLSSNIWTARTEHVPSSWAGIAARLIHFVSGAYNSHSPLVFQVAFVSLRCLKVPGKLVGCRAVDTPSTSGLLPEVIVVVLLFPHCHPIPPGKRAKISMILTTAHHPSSPPPDLEQLNVLHTSC